MVSLFLLLGCNLSYIVDFFAALHELASASARTLLIKLVCVKSCTLLLLKLMKSFLRRKDAEPTRRVRQANKTNVAWEIAMIQ